MFYMIRDNTIRCDAMRYVMLCYVMMCRVVMGMSRGKGTHECLDVIKEYVAVDKIDFIQVN